MAIKSSLPTFVIFSQAQNAAFGLGVKAHRQLPHIGGKTKAISPASIATPAPALITRNGYYGGSAFSIYYSQMYVTPREVKFGNLTGDALVSGIIWNATRFDDSLTSIQYELDQGIAIRSSVAPGGNLRRFGSMEIAVDAAMEGSATIDTQARFSFGTYGDILLPITGSRVVVFAHSPQAGFKEQFQWLTAISPSYASEMRSKMRQKPRGSYSYAFIVDWDEVPALMLKFKNWGFRKWSLPAWHLGDQVEGLNAGMNVIPVVTAGLPYAVGGSIIVWQSESVYHATTIESVTDVNVVLRDPLPEDVPAGYVAPMVFARAVDGVGTKRTSNQNWAEVSATFSMDAVTLPGITTEYPMHKGEYVYDTRLAAPGKTEKFIQPYNVFDTKLGEKVYIATQANTHYTGAITIRTAGRSEYLKLTRFLNHVGGMNKTFWLPEWSAEFKLTQDTVSTDNFIVIEFNQRLFTAQTADLHFSIDGATKIINVLSCVNNDDGTMNIILDSPFGDVVSYLSDYSISNMRRVRLDSDSLSISHQSKFSSSLSVTVREPRGVK